MKNRSRLLKRNHIIIILLSYIVFASIFGYAYRLAINPDGVAQLRLAGYIAEGNFQQAITHTWSPLITWLYSPFLAMGLDGLTSARIAIAFCGAGLLFSAWLLSARVGLSQGIRLTALLITSLLIANFSIRNIGADLPFAALVTLYFYLVLDPDILSTKKIPFIAGLTAGFSYLAHHYTMPFFFIHFPAILLLKGSLDKEKLSFKKILIPLSIGITGFILIASIWIGMVSVKYGQLTISSKGGIAHSAMGPPDIDRHAPHFYGGLNVPKNEYAIHVFEDPSDLEFPQWSPFESKEYFMHQLKLILTNIHHIFNHFVRQSPFFNYAFILCTLTLIPIAILLNPLNEERKFMYLWGLLTFSIFSSGYILIIARAPRRFYALMIIFLLICFHFVEELVKAVSSILSSQNKKLLTFYVFLIIIPAFALKPSIQLFTSLKNIITVEQVNPYKEIAEQLRTIDFQSPYAIIRSSQKPPTDLYITYFLDKQLLGRPLSTDLDGITKELKVVEAKSLVVFDNLETVDKLKNDERYVHIGSKQLKSDKRYEQAINIAYQYHEIITGWDRVVNVFKIK